MWVVHWQTSLFDPNWFKGYWNLFPPQQASLLNLMCWILSSEFLSAFLNQCTRQIALCFFHLHHISLQCNCTVTSSDYSLKAFALSNDTAKYVCGPRPVEGAWETANQSPIDVVLITSFCDIFHPCLGEVFIDAWYWWLCGIKQIIPGWRCMVMKSGENLDAKDLRGDRRNKCSSTGSDTNVRYAV